MHSSLAIFHLHSMDELDQTTTFTILVMKQVVI